MIGRPVTTTVIVAPRARGDLFSIVRHLAKVAGPEIAGRWDDKFWEGIDRLRDFPGVGTRRPRLGRDVWMIVVAPYLIFYRHSACEPLVIILRVLHGRRRISRKLVQEA